jgi:hypothetical protein
MLDPSLLASAFVLVGLSLFVLAFLLYRQAPHRPELRFTAVVTGVLGVVSVALALLGWMESRFSEDTNTGSRLHLCGKLTSRKRWLTDVRCSSPVVR